VECSPTAPLANNDTAPSTTAGIDFPIRVLAINAMGLHLLDYLRFVELVPLCEDADRCTFLCAGDVAVDRRRVPRARSSYLLVSGIAGLARLPA
jgi:hypothetical protein